MKAYLLIALFSKVLKSLFEVLCYFLVDGLKYTNFIVGFHQTQLFSNWMLSGFSAAGYHYYGDKPKCYLHKNTLFLLIINCCCLFFIFILIYFLFNKKTNILPLVSAFLLCICISSSLYFRAHGLLIKSIYVLELVPFMTLLLFILLSSNYYPINLEYLLIICFFIPACYSLIKIYSNNTKRTEPFSIEIYKVTLPFFIVSALNMFLSKADTSVLLYFAKNNDISSYILSSRISGLILSISYIFQHLFLPDIINNLKLDLIDNTKLYIKKYIKYSFLFGLITILSFSIAFYFDIFSNIGLKIDFKLLLVCSFFYLIITPLSIFTYLLIIKKHLLIVLIFSSLGFVLTIILIYIFKNSLDNMHIAVIFLSSILIIKILEYLFYQYHYSYIKKF